MTGIGKDVIAEAACVELTKLTGLAEITEKALKRGVLISRDGNSKNRIYVRGGAVRSQGVYRVEIIFYILNEIYEDINKKFWDLYEKKAPPSREMIFVNFEHVAAKILNKKTFQYINNYHDLGRVIEFIHDCGPDVLNWVLDFENDDAAIEKYQNTNWLRSTWYPLVDYTLFKTSLGNASAIRYANSLDEDDLPPLLASMAQFLKSEQP